MLCQTWHNFKRKEMASGTKPTPGVVGYMDQAVTLIAQALAFVAELPQPKS